MVFEDIRIKNVHAILRYTPNIKKWRAKDRKNHIIGIQLNGSVYHNFGYKDFVLKGYCIYFFNQKDNYDAEVYEQGVSFSVHFTTYEEIDTESFCVPIKNPAEFIALLQKAEHLKNSFESNELSLLSSLYKLCGIISQSRQREYLPRDMRMHMAKSYIDEKFKESDCLHMAIAQSGLSSRRFNDLFKGHFNTTPNRYIVLRRIECAKSLLETQSLTITEISELCGFSDVYYFSNVFKQICGVPPSKWK